MGYSKDVQTSANGWIHELARAEIHPDAEKLLQLGSSFEPQQLVEENAIILLSELRGYFNDYARAFNSYSENGNRFQEVKVYSIAQTASDFMVFRNQVKLVVCNPAHGVIQLAFAQHLRGGLAVNGMQLDRQSPADAELPQSQDLIAQVGPFRDVFWTFQGEKVTAEQVAKFYFAEFVRATRDTKRSKSGNKLLLEQIKTLLQEKGLDL